MRLIQHNPYRTIGLLVGATAREQERQIKRLKHYVEAELDAEADWSFPFLGELSRTIETVNDAASKLNLDSDKMSAALFWFYNGNPITDEPAFEALKDGNPKLAIEIWRKLVGAQGDSYNEVTKRNASAFHNLSILYLQLSGVGVEALQLGLRYLESQFFNDLREKATDETYKISKKELQLIFLNKLFADGGNDSVRFCEVISQIEFSAKEDFLKELIQSPIEQLEKKIDEANTKRKTNKDNAIDAGEALYKEAVLILGQVKSIAGESDFKYTSIADKVANEILQCSIDYWNFSQQSGSDTNFVEKCRKLAISSDEIAIGKPTRLRISENLGVFKQRADKELLEAIHLLKSIRDAYETNKEKITAQVKAMRLSYDQTINWTKVNEMIQNSIEWDKVVVMVQEVITPRSIEKIKNNSNKARIDEYKSLVDFLMGKLNYTQINKVKYLSYWKTEDVVSNVAFTVKSFPSWVKLAGGIAIFLLIVWAIWGEDGLAVVVGIASFFGFLFLIALMKNALR